MTSPSDPLSATDLTGKVALVTGAGRGIGRACAHALAVSGAHVIAVSRTRRDLDDLASDAPEGHIKPWVEDVCDSAFTDRVEALPVLDILVNNAGVNRPGPFAETSPDNLDLLLDLNVRATFRAAQATVRVMLRSGTAGCIVNVTSQMGHVGAPDRTVYCMTKHAVEGLTKAMAVELAPRGIRVNAVAPTFVHTPMTETMLADPEFRQAVLDRIPTGKLATGEEVASAVLYLVSPAARSITGHSLRIDGGWTAQ